MSVHLLNTKENHIVDRAESVALDALLCPTRSRSCAVRTNQDPDRHCLRSRDLGEYPHVRLQFQVEPVTRSRGSRLHAGGWLHPENGNIIGPARKRRFIGANVSFSRDQGLGCLCAAFAGPVRGKKSSFLSNGERFPLPATAPAVNGALPSDRRPSRRMLVNQPVRIRQDSRRSRGRKTRSTVADLRLIETSFFS